MSIPRYQAYKESSVSWLSPVPSHWRVLRLKHACEVFPSNVDKHSREDETPVQLCNYTDVYYNERITSDMPFMAATASAEQIARFSLKGGDTIITKDSETADDIAIAAYVPEDLPGVVCGYHLSMVRPRGSTCGAYVKRLFDSFYAKARFATAANGLTRVGLGQYALDNVELPFPPPAEQQAIAIFLDHETGKIDALVEEQRRLIELLKEKRQAVISQAVTKGLNPIVSMKDSGVEWLGKVPAHWTVCALRRVIANIEQGWSPECDAAPADDQSWGVLKAGCVNRGVFNPSENKSLPDALTPIVEYEVRSGDVLVSRASGSPELVGSAALVGETRSKLMLSDKIFRVHLTPLMTSPFFVWAMNGKALRDQIERALSGGNGLANNLPQSAMLAFLVAVPPVEEQWIVSTTIEGSVRKCDELIAEGARAVDFLQERRAALISAAVTGKIDVRGLVPVSYTHLTRRR